MSSKLSYERYCWFDGQARAGQFPNARTLAEWAEISQKQAQRDIEFMRERLNVPLFFNHEHNGYETPVAGSLSRPARVEALVAFLSLLGAPGVVLYCQLAVPLVVS